MNFEDSTGLIFSALQLPKRLINTLHISMQIYFNTVVFQRQYYSLFVMKTGPKEIFS